MSRPLRSVCFGVLCVSCVGANYVPNGVAQEIGAVHYLKESKARWECLGGEELALVEQPGKAPRLYVASQDLLVDQAKEDAARRTFEFVRDPSLANGTAIATQYSVPKDANADLEVVYGNIFTTSSKTDTDTWKSGDTTYTMTTTRRTFDLFMLWADRCVPHGTDQAAHWSRVYRGAEPVSSELPAERFVVSTCVFNNAGDGKLLMGRRTDINWDAQADLKLFRASAITPLHTVNMALVPPIVWADREGRVTMSRVDGTGIRLTHPLNLWGTDGFMYERASVPVFVTLKPGSEAVFLFVADPKPPPPGTEPRQVGSGVNGTFAAWCKLEKTSVPAGTVQK